jgi:RNA recognition motif-containing protein
MGVLQTWRWQQNKRSKGYAAPSLGNPGVVKDDRKTVFVKNLPFRATEDDILAFFGQAGKVVDVRRGAAADGRICI